MENLRVIGICLLIVALFCAGCDGNDENVPVVGFIEAFEDATIAEARKGFTDALADSGYSEDTGTVQIIHRNAQGDAATLNQIVSYLVNKPVTLIGTSTTLATLAAVQRSKTIPVFMTVTAMPYLLGLTDKSQASPVNLYGTGEELHYIDTSFSIIPEVMQAPPGRKLRVGMVYNQAEPQSVDAHKRIDSLSSALGLELVALPLNSSSEAQLVTRSLLNRNIDAFFANPDNTVFAAFEVILKNCNEQKVPVFTSEAGLVTRGAVAAFGADIYQWGYQSGAQAAVFLKEGKPDGLAIERVKYRKRLYNPQAADRFGLVFPEAFQKAAVAETAGKP